MAMFRSAIGIALRQTQPASRLFSSAARRSPKRGSATGSTLRRPSPVSSFTGCSNTTRRMLWSYGLGGNDGGKSSKAFWSQHSTWQPMQIDSEAAKLQKFNLAVTFGMIVPLTGPAVLRPERKHIRLWLGDV